MRIGDKVLAYVNGGEWCEAQVIGIKGTIVIVSGEEELRRCAEANREPVGVGLQRQRLKVINPVNTP